MERCTVLINSCDKYEDTWYPFFKILQAEWNDRPWPIVLNTETKEYDYDNMGIKTFQLYNNSENIPWGKRLIDTLKKIETEYVLMLLDDFFLTDKVDQDILNQCVEWMDADSNIAVFSFMPTPGENIKLEKYKDFEKRPQDGAYRLNCQAAIWRRECLIKYTKKNESPWDWEILGSLRSRKYTEEFWSYCGERPPFLYELENWSAIHRGKWVAAVVKPLFEKYNIDIDLSIRGVDENPFYVEEDKRTFMRKVYDRIRYISARYFCL